MDKQSLKKLFQNHYQANHRLWLSVIALDDRQFTQPLSKGHPSIRAEIVGMVAQENLWVNYLWHGEVEFLQESQFLTRPLIREEWDALEEEICDFIDELTPADLESQVRPDFLNSAVPLRIGEILLQIVYHASESRTQIYHHLQRLGSATAA